MEVAVESYDGAPHEVQLYADISAGMLPKSILLTSF